MAKGKFVMKKTQSKEALEDQRKFELNRLDKWNNQLHYLKKEVEQKQDEYIKELEKEEAAKEAEKKRKAEAEKENQERKAAAKKAAQEKQDE